MYQQSQLLNSQRNSLSAWIVPCYEEENEYTNDSECSCRPPRPPRPPRPCPPHPSPCPKPCPPEEKDKCAPKGELVRNPGMENFTLGVPTSWNTTTPNLVSPVTSSGRVHSGQSAVNLRNNANLSQMINSIHSGCFYEFSFFAHAIGCNVALSATVTFITPNGETQGALISIESRDIPNTSRNFGYYKAITTAAPKNTTSARITFAVSSSGSQAVVIDDVSLTAQ